MAKVRTEVEQEEGYLKVLTEDRGAQAQAILETFALGIKDLSASYPDYFRLSEARPKQ